jgi:hypothetical protein
VTTHLIPDDDDRVPCCGEHVAALPEDDAVCMHDAAHVDCGPPPWDVFTANGGDLAGLPAKDWPRFDGPACPSGWTPPGDDSAWSCSLPTGHTGIHRASDGTSVVAEWPQHTSSLHNPVESEPTEGTTTP